MRRVSELDRVGPVFLVWESNAEQAPPLRPTLHSPRPTLHSSRPQGQTSRNSSDQDEYKRLKNRHLFSSSLLVAAVRMEARRRPPMQVVDGPCV